MKRLILAFICIISIRIVDAQDRIVLRNADELKVKVINISPDTVTYKRWDNLEGPTYTTFKSDIIFINYQNGVKETFVKKHTNMTELFVCFQGYANLGFICCPTASIAGPTIGISAGVSITDYFYVGFETGFHSFIFKEEDYKYIYTRLGGYIPFALNMKGYFTKRQIRPFINVSLGGFAGVSYFNRDNGFYFQTGAGVDIKRLTLGIGYQGLVAYGDTLSNIYFNIGIRFGGKKYW